MSWADLPAAVQDALILIGCLAVPLVLAIVLVQGFQPLPLVTALIRRHWAVSLTFTALIGVGVAVGTALLSSERGLREASARATDPFDVVVAAPGSEVTALLASIFLRPSDVALLDPTVTNAVLDDPRATLAAPIGFGDSVDGAPVIGTVAALPEHLASAIDGRMWTGPFEAIVGADLGYPLGSIVEPVHGHGSFIEENGSHGQPLTIVGRMMRTGTPWDGAVLMPIEGVWALHGMTDGRSFGADMRLGPPYDPALAPGVPAVLVRADTIGGVYSLRSAFQRDGASMAFLPGAQLAQLHALIGDAREALSVMILVALGLVSVAVLCGLVIVAQLFRRQLALLAALGAPRRFTLAVLWCHAMAHLATGALAGLVLGWLAAVPVSRIVSVRTGLSVTAPPGTPEALTVAAFLALASLAGLLTAVLAGGSEPAKDLR